MVELVARYLPRRTKKQGRKLQPIGDEIRNRIDKSEIAIKERGGR
jgi:hypothetical protein